MKKKVKKYKCPRCNREEAIDLGDDIKCLSCDSTYLKEFIDKFEDKPIILSNEELDRWFTDEDGNLIELWDGIKK